MNKLMDLLSKGYTIEFTPQTEFNMFSVTISKLIDKNKVQNKHLASFLSVKMACVDVMSLELSKMEQEIEEMLNKAGVN